MIVPSALTALALLLLPAALAAPTQPPSETDIKTALRAASLDARADLEPAHLEARGGALRPIEVILGEYTVIHHIGSSPLGYWSYVGPYGVTLTLDGGDFTTEMFQYYVFKPTGDWRPWKTDTVTNKPVPMNVAEIVGQKAGDIERTVKCAVTVQKGAEGLPGQGVTLLRQEPWFEYDQGPGNHIESVICITEW